MTVTASLNTSELVVDAGSEQYCDVVIRNTGDVVDQFAVDVVGAAAGWAMVLPETINLMPGVEQTVQVVFAPPRTSEVPSGVVPFAVRVRSREDPHGSTVQEGTVEVTPFTALSAQLVPPKRRGRLRARFRLEVANEGNSPVACRLQGYHPDEQDVLDVKLAYAELVAEAGTVTTVKVTTLPAKRFLRGEPRLHPFVVEVLGEGPGQLEVGEPTLIDGVMIQQALLAAWMVKAALIAVAAVVALVVLWYAVLVPRVESIATAQVAPQVQAAMAAADQAGAAATTAAVAANIADPSAAAAAGIADPRVGAPPAAPATGAAGVAPGSPGGVPGQAAGAAGAVAAAANAVEFRIAAAAPPVTDGSYAPFSYSAPDGKGLAISDIVLQNPRGDTGLLQIKFGDDVVLEVGLANFRDLDYHYINALQVKTGQPVVVAVSCTTPGPGPTQQCTPAVSFSATSSG